MIGTHGPLVLGLLALAGLVASHSAAAIPSEANPAYDPQADRPFKVPLYPLLPLVFCAACAWLTYSSISYAISQNAIHVSGWLIATGVLAWLVLRWRESRHTASESSVA
jgi:hypothetical protein